MITRLNAMSEEDWRDNVEEADYAQTALDESTANCPTNFAQVPSHKRISTDVDRNIQVKFEGRG